MVLFYDCTRESTERQDREDGDSRLAIYFGFWFLFRLPFHSQDLLQRGIRRVRPSCAAEQLTRCTRAREQFLKGTKRLQNSSVQCRQTALQRRQDLSGPTSRLETTLHSLPQPCRLDSCDSHSPPPAPDLLGILLSSQGTHHTSENYNTLRELTPKQRELNLW